MLPTLKISTTKCSATGSFDVWLSLPPPRAPAPCLSLHVRYLCLSACLQLNLLLFPHSTLYSLAGLVELKHLSQFLLSFTLRIQLSLSSANSTILITLVSFLPPLSYVTDLVQHFFVISYLHCNNCPLLDFLILHLQGSFWLIFLTPSRVRKLPSSNCSHLSGFLLAGPQKVRKVSWGCNNVKGTGR